MASPTVAAALALGCAGVGFTGIAAAASPAPAASSPTVHWRPCPQYSNAVLGYLGIRPQDYPKFRALWARTECGTVKVPLDYRHPEGKKITIALTRLRAKDQAHRLSSLAMNPGGPGGSGYLMPATLVLESSTDAQLHERYDLIGFDPRGVGYSTSYDCRQNGGGPPAVNGQLTKAALRQLFDAGARHDTPCSSANPAFLCPLPTANLPRLLPPIPPP